MIMTVLRKVSWRFWNAGIDAELTPDKFLRLFITEYNGKEEITADTIFHKVEDLDIFIKELTEVRGLWADELRTK